MQKLAQTGFSDGTSGVDNATTIKNPILGDSLNSLTGQGFLSKVIPTAIGLIYVFGFIFFVFMFLWGAVSYILSGGDKGSVEAAKGRLTNALVGIILLLSTMAIVKIVEVFFGINILSIDIGPLVIQ